MAILPYYISQVIALWKCDTLPQKCGEKDYDSAFKVSAYFSFLKLFQY